MFNPSRAPEIFSWTPVTRPFPRGLRSCLYTVQIILRQTSLHTVLIHNWNYFLILQRIWSLERIHCGGNVTLTWETPRYLNVRIIWSANSDTSPWFSVKMCATGRTIAVKEVMSITLLLLLLITATGQFPLTDYVACVLKIAAIYLPFPCVIAFHCDTSPRI